MFSDAIQIIGFALIVAAASRVSITLGIASGGLVLLILGQAFEDVHILKRKGKAE